MQVRIFHLVSQKPVPLMMFTLQIILPSVQVEARHNLMALNGNGRILKMKIWSKKD